MLLFDNVQESHRQSDRRRLSQLAFDGLLSNEAAVADASGWSKNVRIDSERILVCPICRRSNARRL